MSYAIITVGGKQYRVQEGERLLVDRLQNAEGETFEPRVLLVGGNGSTDLAPRVTVTARVVGHVLGDKVRIGKYKRRTGYRRHTGFRAHLTQIEIESIGAAARKAAAKKEAPAAKPEAEEAAPAGLPAGYAEMTVADIAAATGGWSRAEVEAALEYERAHASRKTALAALEGALKAEEED
jgi:large subunit ribosomal protein L21